MSQYLEDLYENKHRFKIQLKSTKADPWNALNLPKTQQICQRRKREKKLELKRNLKDESNKYIFVSVSRLYLRLYGIPDALSCGSLFVNFKQHPINTYVLSRTFRRHLHRQLSFGFALSILSIISANADYPLGKLQVETFQS